MSHTYDETVHQLPMSVLHFFDKEKCSTLDSLNFVFSIDIQLLFSVHAPCNSLNWNMMVFHCYSRRRLLFQTKIV